jgi:hypothetical protein
MAHTIICLSVALRDARSQTRMLACLRRKPVLRESQRAGFVLSVSAKLYQQELVSCLQNHEDVSVSKERVVEKTVRRGEQLVIIVSK